jgi:glutaredoxin
MSKLSEKRKQEPATPPKKGPSWLWILIAAGVLVAAWASYDYSSYRHASTLDGFAKCLTEKGFRMYGAWWCPHCADQKSLFGRAFQHVSYTECGIEGQTHGENEQCKQAGIKHFPTWQFPDGSREEGVFTPSELSQKSGCKLP